MGLQLVALYVGPDQVMPVASILATVLGLILLFWNRFLNLLRRMGEWFRRRVGRSEVSSGKGK